MVTNTNHTTILPTTATMFDVLQDVAVIARDKLAVITRHPNITECRTE